MLRPSGFEPRIDEFFVPFTLNADGSVSNPTPWHVLVSVREAL
jgi:hypothetical protein